MIAIADAGGSNIASLRYAFHRLGIKSELTADPEKIYKSSHVIIPGVGAAAHSISRLQQLELVHVLQELKQPTLGVCVGMQLLFTHSDEGSVDLLNILDGTVQAIKDTQLVVPHMGWNQITWVSDSSLLQKNIPNGENFYFVHSFAADPVSSTTAVVEYGKKYSAIVEKDNYFGVQFHPEKSSVSGAQLLRNFSLL